MAHPTHLTMAAKGAREAPFFIAAQRIEMAVTSATLIGCGFAWLPLNDGRVRGYITITSMTCQFLQCGCARGILSDSH